MITQRQIATLVSKCVEETIITVSLRRDEDGFLIERESKLCEMVRGELMKAGVSIQKKRQATVRPGNERTLETVQNYLPHNYQAFREPCTDTKIEPYILIEGYDYAGWTLDGYVIPRLSSGLIYAKEVTDYV